MILDNSSLIAVYSLMPNVSVSGSTKLTAIKGQYTVDDISIRGSPGYQASFLLESTTIDKTVYKALTGTPF